MSMQTKETKAQSLNRRQFLIQVGAASAVITVAGAGVAAVLNSQRPEPTASEIDPATGTDAGLAQSELPNAGAAVEPAPGTRPEYTPVEDHYRIDIAALPPSIDGESYVLPIMGLVNNEVELTLDQIRNDYEPKSLFITMGCISNRIAGDLISTTLWTGPSFRDLISTAEPMENATHIRIFGADGFDETVALDDVMNDETIIIAYDWDGQPLPRRYGFPLRIHIPNRYGMKQPKWIERIELIEGDEDGYWVRRGWSKEAFINATSVIDTVATDMMIIDEETEDMVVPIGGIAWAGPRRVSRVEVRVDDGEWQEAQLRAPLNNDPDDYRTWVIWRYDWPFEAGDHIFTVRMYEGDGTQQIEAEQGVRPDGATGLHSMDAML